MTRPPALAVVALVAGAALADEAPAKVDDRPRWRVRAGLSTGFGGSYDHGSVAVFPTTLELGARIWGPLSATVGVTGVLSGDYYFSCGGEPRRANAVFGSAGLRVDFANRKSKSWAAPFVEAHGGVGGQSGGRPDGGGCPGGGVFGTGGVRGGLDVWLGRAAVTAALGFDWAPVAPPIAFTLGATFVLR